MHGAVGIGAQNGAPIGIRAQRTVGGGILHMIGGIVAACRGVHQIVDAVAFHHERSLKEVGDFRIGDEPCLCKTLHVGIQSARPTAESLVDAPCAPVHVDLAVIVGEGLSVERDGVFHESVGHKHGLALAENVAPRAPRRVAHAHVEVAGLAIDHVVAAVAAAAHHVRGPYPVAVGPVHGQEGPVEEVLARPALRRAEARPAAVGGGIYIIGVAKLLHRGVGKVARNKRVEGSGSVVGLLP